MRGGWAAGRKVLARWYQPPAQKDETWTQLTESGLERTERSRFPGECLREGGRRERGSGTGESSFAPGTSSHLSSPPPTRPCWGSNETVVQTA